MIFRCWSTFFSTKRQRMNRPVPTPPPELLALFSVYDFPGNIRELQAMVFDAMSRNESEKLSLHSFQGLIHQEPNVETSVPPEATSVNPYPAWPVGIAPDD